MVGMSRKELADASDVAERTIADFESGRREPIKATLAALAAALEEAGLILLPPNGHGPGVALKAEHAAD